MGWKDAPLANASWKSAPLANKDAVTAEQFLAAQKPPGYLDPNVTQRGAILPLGRTASGGLTPAMPQMGIDAIEASKIPGRAWSGENITPEEATGFALTFGTPALRGIGSTVSKSVPGTLSRAEIKAAPTSEQLKQQGGKLFDKAEGTAAIVSPESYADTLAALESKMYRKGFDPDMHSEASSALKAIGKRIGDPLDMQEMMIVRQLAGEAANSIDPKTARQGSIMVEHIDKYIEGLGADDLLNGNAAGVGASLKEARGLWTKMHKSKIIDDIFENADLQASGFENGLRIGFRSLLKDKRKSRSFTADEKAAMKEIATGTFTTNTLKRLGKLGGGTGQQTNTLGAVSGAGGGAVVGNAVAGPVGAAVGAAAVPAVGYAAQKAGEAATRSAANRVRANVASPPAPVSAYSGTRGLERATLGQLLQGRATPKKRGKLTNDLMNRLAAKGVI